MAREVPPDQIGRTRRASERSAGILGGVDLRGGERALIESVRIRADRRNELAL